MRSARRRFGAVICIIALVASTASVAVAYPRPGRTELASLSSDGSQANHRSGSPDVGAGGRYVAFESFASNLVADDGNGSWDVFVRDAMTGITERVSLGSDDTEGDKDSSQFDMSGDGRYVAFRSPSTNLVAGDTNGTSDIFVRDRHTATTALVSQGHDGTPANGVSLHPAVSGNGRLVSFRSMATNIVADDTNGASDLFVHDLETGTTQRLSVANDGAEAVGESFVAAGTALSFDGRFVAFESYATNLVDGDSNDQPDVFVHDRDTQTTERVSLGADGEQAAGSSLDPAISADGRYVAFISSASNLVPGDRNGASDAFVHDRQTGQTERISVASDGAESSASSPAPGISADGRLVTFASGAADLVAGDDNASLDVFVHDRVAGSTQRLSVADDGSEGASDSFEPALSPDGRYAVFTSRGTLVTGDANGHFDVFVRDLGPPNGVGDITLVPQADVITANGWATFSGRGTSVTDSADDGATGAASAGGELVGAGVIHRPESEDVLVRLELDSLPTSSGDAGVPGTLYGLRFALDATSYEVRATRSSTGAALFALYRCESSCHKVVDLTGSIGTTGPVVLVSVPLVALEVAETALSEISAFTAFGDLDSGAITDLDQADVGDVEVAGPRVSLGIAAAGTPQSEVSFDTATALSNGTFTGDIGVSSLPSGDYDVWAKGCHADLCGAASAPVSIDNGAVKGRTELSFAEESVQDGQHSDDVTIAARLIDATGASVSDADIGFELMGESSSRTFTATTDGTGLASASVNLTDQPGSYRLIARYEGSDTLDGSSTETNFVIEKEDAELELSLAEVNGAVLTARLSDLDSPGRGIPLRTVDFSTDGEPLASGQTDLQGVVSVELPSGRTGNESYSASFAGDSYYRAANATVYPPPGRTDRVSVGAAGEANEDSNTPSRGRGIASGGRYVAFHSLASNLVAGDTNGAWDVFLRDRETRKTSRLLGAGGVEGNDDSFGPALTPDGRQLAFWSSASNLVAGDTNDRHDVFVRAIGSGDLTRVSRSSDGTEGDGDSHSPAISADGRFVAFNGTASNLVDGDANEASDIFVHDRDSGSTERVSVATDGSEGNGGSFWTSISADGRYVSFRSAASNLVAGDTNEAWDVFVHDRVSGTTERVSVADDESQATGGSDENAISADGRFVVFRSHAGNLVPEDTPASYDIFVRDRAAGTTERVSIATSGRAPNGNSIYLSISADGRYVTFSSFASNLVPGDTNATTQLFSGGDVFVHDRATRTTERVSVASDGSEGDDESFLPSISPDGRYVEFMSAAANLVARDTNEGMGNGVDVFVRDRGPETGIGDVDALLDDADLSLAGWVHFSGRTVSSRDDPRDDATLGARSAGAELTGARLVDRPGSGDVLLWLTLDSLPATGAGGTVPGTLYGLELRIEGTRHEVRATRGADGLSRFALYRCVSSCLKVEDLTGGIGTSGPEVLVTVPGDVLELPARVTDLRAFTATGDIEQGSLTVFDEVSLPDTDIEAPRVSLAIAPAGTPLEDVSFGSDASLSGDSFTGALDVASLPAGDYDAWAKGCHAGTCGAMSTQVTLPTAGTEVFFTERSANAGQYSDEALFEARLVDADGDSVGNEDVTFELTGAESQRSFTATTDAAGVAAVTVTLAERPGPHQLTVHFAGNDTHTGSSDTSSFVIDKEDTELVLSIAGNGNNRTLEARLSDADTSSDGIDGRSIAFYVGDELIGSASTDGDGVATLKPPPRYRGGKRDFVARFEGDDFYIASSDGETS